MVGEVIYASAAMMVSLGHPQTHVGERGEPSKFEKKFVQDSCTVYMILVHKPLTARNSRACPAAIGLHARGTRVPRVDQCPFGAVVAWCVVP